MTRVLAAVVALSLFFAMCAHHHHTMSHLERSPGVATLAVHF